MNLTVGKTTSYLLSPGNITEFTVRNLTKSVAYVMFQIHTQYNNISVSSTADLLDNSTVCGSHIGFVTHLKKDDIQASWFVRCDSNKTVSTVIVVSTYTESGK